MKHRCFILIIVSCLLCITFPVFSQEPVADMGETAEARISDELYYLREESHVEIMVFTGLRYEHKLSESPSAISVITKEEIRRSPFRNIPELLQYVVGMDGFTKTHTDMDVSARGFAYDETPKTLVLLDGQPLNIVAYSGVQWPTIPITLEDIERIEVLRGPGSAVWGADALAGVINIITKKVKDRKNTVSAQYGERDAGNYDVHISNMITKRLGLAFTGGFVQTEHKGDAETSEAKVNVPNYEIKDWAQIFLANYRLDYDGDAMDFFSWGGVSADDEGYNSIPGNPSVDSAEKITLNLNNKLTWYLDEDNIMLRLGYRGLDQRNEKWDEDTEEYVFNYKIKKSDGVDLDLQYTINRIENHTIIAGANYSHLWANMDIANTIPYSYDESEALWAGYGQDQIRLFDDLLLLTVGGRYDKWTNTDGVFTPRAAANIFFWDKKITTRLAAGRSFRRPSFHENFYYATQSGGWLKGADVTAITENGEVITGDTLNPEKLTAYEAGIRFEPNKKLSLNLEYFQNYIKDIIGYEVFYENTQTNELNMGLSNLPGEVFIQGVELEVKNKLTSYLHLFFNYTYQWAEIEDENGANERWRNAPKHKTSAGLFYQGPVDVDLRLRYVSDVTYHEVPSIEVDDYITADMALSKEIKNNYFVKLSALNLLDDNHYEYPIYTQSARRIMFTFQYTW
ncbi:MAG: TonB-dependent receptor [Candidatus Kuenenia sp.]|nr:TonB-dependent receptor [Candidatus Kuenenia sp.]